MQFYIFAVHGITAILYVAKRILNNIILSSSEYESELINKDQYEDLIVQVRRFYFTQRLLQNFASLPLNTIKNIQQAITTKNKITYNTTYTYNVQLKFIEKETKKHHTTRHTRRYFNSRSIVVKITLHLGQKGKT